MAYSDEDDPLTPIQQDNEVHNFDKDEKSVNSDSLKSDHSSKMSPPVLHENKDSIEFYSANENHENSSKEDEHITVQV